MNVVVVDGPYGMGKYEGDVIRTRQTRELYRATLQRAEEVADHIVVFGLFESLAWIHECCRPQGMFGLRRDVIWEKPDSTAGGLSTFAPRYEMFLHYGRIRAQFNADAIRVPYGERALSGVKMKGGKVVGWQPNPLGARCGDVLRIVSDRLANKQAGRTSPNRHPCVKPKELLRIIVKSMSDPGCAVYEPFVGSRNLSEVCEELGRQYFGYERAEEFAALPAEADTPATGGEKT